MARIVAAEPRRVEFFDEIAKRAQQRAGGGDFRRRGHDR